MGDEGQDGVVSIDGCDACAAEGVPEAPVAETLRLSLRDLSADVAVCARHRALLEEVVAATLAHAREAGRIPSQRVVRAAAGFPRLQDGEDREVIRAWARARGLPVAASGTISAAVLTRYREARAAAVESGLAPHPQTGTHTSLDLGGEVTLPATSLSSTAPASVLPGDVDQSAGTTS